MIPLPTLLLSLFVAGIMYRAWQLVLGHPLPEVLQLGLLLVCAWLAAVEAHWAWTVRQGPQRFHAALWRGELLPREQAQAIVTQEEP